MKRLNRNSIPFFILIIIHTVMIIVTFAKKRERKTLFVLLLSNVGLGYLFEYFVFNLFQGYTYKPRILKKKYIDNVFGALLSQGNFVPFTAVFITAFKLGWKAKIGFALYFTMVERLFIKLKVYKNNWWRTIYTGTLMPVFFTTSDIWYKKIKEGNPIVLFISLFYAILVTSANLLYLLVTKKKLKFGIGEYKSWKEHFIVAPVYSVILSLTGAWTIRKDGWKSKIYILGFSTAVDWVVKKMNIIKFKTNNYLSILMSHVFTVTIATFYKKLIYSHRKCSK